MKFSEIPVNTIFIYENKKYLKTSKSTKNVFNAYDPDKKEKVYFKQSEEVQKKENILINV